MYTIRLSSPDDAERICAFFRNAHVIADRAGATLVNLQIPGAPTPAHELREITGYVTTWNALNPGHAVSLASDEAA